MIKQVGFTLLGLALGSSTTMAAPRSASHDAALAPIPEPPTISSQAGRLDATLIASPAKIEVAGQTFASNVYNGTYVPPVLRVKRGDDVHIKLVNRIGDSSGLPPGDLVPEMTNLHYHGMAIPPKLPADFIYLLVPPGNARGAILHPGHDMSMPQGMSMSGPVSSSPSRAAANAYNYRWIVPRDHAQGVYWYHPHPHGISEGQVLGGLSGLLVVEGLIERHYPELSDVKRRTFLLKDIQLPGAPDGSPKTKTINGVLGGAINGHPGEFQIWELGNIGADSYFDLEVADTKFWVIERDGNPVLKPQFVNHVFLPPASRATIVIQIGPKGLYDVRTRKVDTGSAGDPNPNVVLATVVAAGKHQDNSNLVARMSKPPARIGSLGPTEDEIRALPVTGNRTIVYRRMQLVQNSSWTANRST